ncbi:TPA: ead/Ea22-like family protein [Escherichia coli]|nr:ead/Ea22-like family protein [Escherichia coli]
MSEINYQALREAAERATPAMERLLMLPVDDDLLSEQELKDYGVDIDALNAFKFLTGPETVLALLDERESQNKRIAELEKSEEQLINERDHAESALSDMYFAATGDRPEWSNCFSFSDAVDAVVDRIADLEAKQPSPVVPDNASGSLAYAYKELTPEIMRGHIAVFERYGIAPNDSITTIQALRIALDGIERSNAMLQGKGE